MKGQVFLSMHTVIGFSPKGLVAYAPEGFMKKLTIDEKWKGPKIHSIKLSENKNFILIESYPNIMYDVYEIISGAIEV